MNANELVKAWPKNQYRGGHPDWMLVGQAIRALDYNRGARYAGVVGKGTRAWMWDKNSYLYRPAANAFVNNIGAELGATDEATTWTRRQMLLTALVVASAIGASAFLLTDASAEARSTRSTRSARTVARRYR